MARIILFGATGYTGRLTAAALVLRGHNPILAGRSGARLSDLAAELGGDTEIAVADASCDASLERLLSRGDVMISTVGPFLRWGDSAVRAAVDRGAHYLDSNGEPPFTRRIFERYDAAAADAGVALLTAFGWENVIGNLAGALALREACGAATRIDTGYFYLGRTRFSGGTRASFAEAMIQPSFAFRDGAIRTVRGAERYRTMPVDVDRRRPAVSLGASEHYALPRAFPQLREVNAYLGWFGGLGPRAARLLHLASRPGFAALRAPGLRALTSAALSRMLRGSSGGPSPAERAGARVHGVAIAYDADGRQLTEAHLQGPEGYELTGALLAWGAERAASEGPRGVGALGPVDAFGLDELEAGCREAGVAGVDATSASK